MCINLTKGNAMALIDENDFTRETEWSELYYFPCHPEVIGTYPLEAYFQNLKVGAVFASNDDSPKLLIREVARNKNNPSILVMCEREGHMCEREGFQPWLIAEITFDVNGFFVHSKLGSYFEKEDADKVFCAKQGLNEPVTYV